jgi:hypothetical protein
MRALRRLIDVAWVMVAMVAIYFFVLIIFSLEA